MRVISCMCEDYVSVVVVELIFFFNVNCTNDNARFIMQRCFARELS